MTLAFLLNMAFSTVPTPLYTLYAARDNFSNLTVTYIYAVYAVGVIGSLFLGGHLSDWVGRRTVLVPALIVNVVSSVVFVVWPSLTGLIVARVISGISVGLTTATATAYLAELYRAARPGAPVQRAQTLATVANIGGIGFGALAAGLLAEYAPAPLRTPYIVFGVAIAAVALVVLVTPETVDRTSRPYRPQRVAVPRAARGTFYAATATGIAAFSVFGLFTSLVPVFLATAMREPSRAVAGAVAFAAFATGAAVQVVLGRWAPRTMLARSLPILTVGLVLFTVGLRLPNLAVFVIGGMVTGAGAALAFRAAMTTAALSAPPESRAEVLAGYFLGGYIGLSLPVVGLGLATQYWPARDAVVVFEILALLTCVVAVRYLLRGPRTTA
ncbi:MFS transporter [Streptomyces sp. NPDC058417]|uniref:MFS transporter n=1 Tax=unclassified Streptomyces TaxID=2593676 RepID=UPI003665032E